MDFTDLTGRTFGRWTVVHRVYTDTPRAPVLWLCTCTCGQQGVVRGSALRSGKTTRCRVCATILKRGDLAGKTFGQWTVQDSSRTAANRCAEWLCMCSCGSEVWVRGASLRSGRSTRCRACASMAAYEREKEGT